MASRSEDEEKRGADGDKAQGGRVSHDELATCTMSQAAFNIFFYMFGATQVPYAMGQMGWLWGTVALAAMSAGSWASGHMLVDICVRRRLHTWPDVAADAFGRVGYTAMQILQTLSFIMTGIVQVQGSGSVWQQAFPDAPICQWKWIIINALPYALFLQIPSFSGDFLLRAATFITLLLTIWRIALMTYYVSSLGRYCNVCYGHQTLTSIMSAAANLVFSFGSHALMPEEVREMRRPKDMFKSWDIANAAAIPLYAAVGMAGMWAFGVFNSGASIILNFRDDLNVRAYLIASAALGYLPLTYGQILLFLKLELRLGVSPRDYWRHSRPEACAARWVRAVPPVIFRLIFRTGVVVAYVVMAEMLLGFGLQNMVSLVGALATTAMTFYLPFILHWKIFDWDGKGARKEQYTALAGAAEDAKAPAGSADKDDEGGEATALRDRVLQGGGIWRAVRLVGYALGTALGLFLAGAGMYYTLKNVLEQQNGAGLFDGACYENSYFLGSDRHRSGDGAYSCGGQNVTGSFYEEFYVPTCVQGRIECSQYGAC